MGLTDVDFEGTVVLEKLAEIGEVDRFLEAVDSDDFKTAGALMRKAGVDAETIQIVFNMMNE